jgi:hypothetical protein
MIGAAESLVLMEHGDLVSSACFQKFYNSGNITSLSTTNQTLQAEQIAEVQVLFGTNPLAETTVDTNSTNTTVSTGQSFEPGVLGVSISINNM